MSRLCACDILDECVCAAMNCRPISDVFVMNEYEQEAQNVVESVRIYLVLLHDYIEMLYNKNKNLI